MSTKKFSFQNLYVCISAIVVFLGIQNAFAVKHIVNFGGSLGLVYSPSSFSAIIGDTVEWVGDFSTHPLSSTTIPTNAASWHVPGGGSFDYPITVAGEYHYRCDVHFSVGMTGSFSVAASGIGNEINRNPAIDGNHALRVVKDESGRLSLRFSLLKPGPVTLTILDLRGQKRATLLHGAAQAGRTVVSLDGKIRGAGIYSLRFGGEPEISRIFIEP